MAAFDKLDGDDDANVIVLDLVVVVDVGVDIDKLACCLFNSFELFAFVLALFVLVDLLFGDAVDLVVLASA